jgi:hypothetical protein
MPDFSAAAANNSFSAETLIAAFAKADHYNCLDNMSYITHKTILKTRKKNIFIIISIYSIPVFSAAAVAKAFSALRASGACA